MDAAPLPELSGDLLTRLWNAGPALHPALVRVLAGALPTERSRVRAAFLIAAARRLNASDASTYKLARRLRERMTTLLRAFPGYIDPGTLDGALAGALLVDGLELPCERTVQRALDP